MKAPQDIKAKSGQDFFEWLRTVLGLFRKEGGITISGNVRVHQTLTGKHVVAEAPDVSFRGSFAVSLVGKNTIQVGPGIVVIDELLRVPTIGGKYIDGVDENGEQYPEGAPQFQLEASGADRSLIYIEVGDGTDDVPDVVIAGESSKSATRSSKAIAQVLWKNGTAVSVRQISYFDQVAELRDDRWVIVADS